jgi:hypothetical protein
MHVRKLSEREPGDPMSGRGQMVPGSAQ